jgi:hypothetical protein
MTPVGCPPQELMVLRVVGRGEVRAEGDNDGGGTDGTPIFYGTILLGRRCSGEHSIEAAATNHVLALTLRTGFT